MNAKQSGKLSRRGTVAIARGPTIRDSTARHSREGLVSEPAFKSDGILALLNKTARNNRSKTGNKPVFDAALIVQSLEMSIGVYRYEILLRDSQLTDQELLDQAQQIASAAHVLRTWLDTMHPRLRDNMRILLDEQEKNLKWDELTYYLYPILNHLRESALAACQMTVPAPRSYRKGPASDQAKFKVLASVHSAVLESFTPALKKVPARNLAAELISHCGISLPASDKYLRLLLAQKRDGVEVEINSLMS